MTSSGFDTSSRGSTIEELAHDRPSSLVHPRALTAMEARSTFHDLARLAHHADAAGDGGAVLRFAPEAAVRASSPGAHREAAAQFRRALGYAELLAARRAAPGSSRATPTSAISPTRATRRSARYGGSSRRPEGARRYSPRGGDPELSRQQSRAPRGEGAKHGEVGVQAVELLERLEPGPELVGACGTLGFLEEERLDSETSYRWEDRAATLARELELDQNWARIGSDVRRVRAGNPGGVEAVERGIAVFRQSGREEAAVDAQPSASSSHSTTAALTLSLLAD